MEPKTQQAIQETQQAQQDRAQNWSKYFRNLIREWQYADESGGRILLNKSDLSKLIRVSDMTIAQWLDGKKYPSRQNCGLVANAFGIPSGDVITAAGYLINQDESYNTTSNIMQAVEKDATLADEDKRHLYNALVTTITPEWIENNSDWLELVRVVLNQRIPLIAKAQRIASIVDASLQEKKS